MSLRAEQVSWRQGATPRLQNVSLTIQPGALHVVLGPNGAGKSSLLSVLAGDQRPNHGNAGLDGTPLAQWERTALARRRAVLMQGEQLRFGFRVEEVVGLGRLPCPPLPAGQTATLIADALTATGAVHLAGRRYTTLSGGERQRVQLARVLAQVWPPSQPAADAPRYLLLDEPTSALDLAHQHDCLALLQGQARAGYGVMAVLHDPNLALAYADEVTVLCCGEVMDQGTPAAVLTPGCLRKVFGVDATPVSAADGSTRLLIGRRSPV